MKKNQEKCRACGESLYFYFIEEMMFEESFEIRKRCMNGHVNDYITKPKKIKKILKKVDI